MSSRLVPLCALVAGVGGVLVTWAVPRTEEVALHVLDVGQGDAILLRQGRLDILIDGGPDQTVLHALGTVRPFWDRRMDVIILTHPDTDHLRGLLEVVDREDVGVVLLPKIPAPTKTFQAFLTALAQRRIPVVMAHAGQRLTRGDLSLMVLAPDDELLRRAQKKRNAGSVVARVDLPGVSVLLTGDIEAPTEQYLLRHVPALLDTDVLKVPHHGSKTSSTPGFLRAVSPQLSVVSVGEGNRYGHPHPSVVRRYAAGTLLRTDQHDTITLRAAPGRPLTVHCAQPCLPGRTPR